MKRIILMLIVITLISNVSSFETSLISQENNICSGALTNVMDILVTNDNQETLKITINSDSNLPIQLNANEFILKQNTKQNIIAYVQNSPNSMTLGNYITLTINAYGSSQNSNDLANIYIFNQLKYQKTYTTNIDINDCPNIAIEPILLNQTSTPCKATLFSFNVYNTGTFPESYHLDVPSLKTGTKFDKNDFILQPNQSTKVWLGVLFDCNKYGVFNFNINAKTKNSKYLAKIPITYNITPNYNYNITAPTNQNLCKNEEKNITLNLENYADLTNTYKIKLNSNLTKIKLINSSITINNKNNSDFDLNINPQKEGMYYINITTTSKYGEIVKDKQIIANVSECYDFKIEPTTTSYTCENQNYIKKINLTNLGSKTNTIKISTTDNTTKITNSEVELKPYQSSEIDLYIKPLSSKKITIDTINTINPDYRSTRSFKIKTINTNECHKTIIKNSKIKAINDSKEINVTLESKAYDENTYQISLEGPKFISLKQKSITLKSKEENNITLILNPTKEDFEKTYPINISLLQKESNQTYTQKINLELTKYNNIFEEIKSKYISDEIKKTTNKYLLYGFSTLLILIIIIISLLIIKKRPKKEKTITIKSEKAKSIKKIKKIKIKNKKEIKKEIKEQKSNLNKKDVNVNYILYPFYTLGIIAIFVILYLTNILQQYWSYIILIVGIISIITASFLFFRNKIILKILGIITLLAIITALWYSKILVNYWQFIVAGLVILTIIITIIKFLEKKQSNQYD